MHTHSRSRTTSQPHPATCHKTPQAKSWDDTCPYTTFTTSPFSAPDLAGPTRSSISLHISLYKTPQSRTWQVSSGCLKFYIQDYLPRVSDRNLMQYGLQGIRRRFRKPLQNAYEDASTSSHYTKRGPYLGISSGITIPYSAFPPRFDRNNYSPSQISDSPLSLRPQPQNPSRRFSRETRNPKTTESKSKNRGGIAGE